MLFSGLAERFTATQLPVMKASSASTAERYLKHLSIAWKMAEVQKIDRYQVEKYLKAEALRYSKNTVKGLRSPLSSVLGWAVDCGWMARNAAKGAKIPRECGGRRVERQVLVPSQVATMVAELDEPYATLLLLLFTTGIRRGEALALRPEDLEGDELCIRRRVYEGKLDECKTRSSRRRIPIPRELRDRLLNVCDGEWIFTASNGSPLNPRNTLRRHPLPAAKAAGLQGINWHSFRHSFVVNQRRNGRMRR